VHLDGLAERAPDSFFTPGFPGADEFMVLRFARLAPVLLEVFEPGDKAPEVARVTVIILRTLSLLGGEAW